MKRASLHDFDQDTDRQPKPFALDSKDEEGMSIARQLMMSLGEMVGPRFDITFGHGSIEHQCGGLGVSGTVPTMNVLL